MPVSAVLLGVVVTCVVVLALMRGQGIELASSCLCSKHSSCQALSTTRFDFTETKSQAIVQAGLELLAILLLPFPQCWD